MTEIDRMVEELKNIRRDKGYTLEYIARVSGVPIGTVNRVFGNTHYAFRYETIRPIIKALTGFDNLDNPDVENPLPDNDTIVILKAVVNEKGEEIARLNDMVKTMSEQFKTEREEIKSQSEAKIDYLKDNVIEPLKKDKVVWRAISIVLLCCLFLMIIIDFFVADKGWFVRQVSFTEIVSIIPKTFANFY